MLSFIKLLLFFFNFMIFQGKVILCVNHKSSDLSLFLYSHRIYENKKKNHVRKKLSILNLKKRLDPNDKYTVIKRHESKIQRNLKRKYMIERYKEKRQQLKKYISEASSPIEYVYWKYKLSTLPRDSCPVRYRNRCAITGRARGYYSFFGLCRHQARSLIQKMFFPGFVKASW
ncbi:apicoplast ribosomal protein S14p/S29e precursor, putative [Plasmodium reichenowi]|uniref:Apicoplast ribosomal protein S14p/S29e, putative n=12 Tax=Plasmodium (Laverania) TaxID=418107 RepID=Q8IHZ0_PLAF7|nr:apicoplast ribosomal protein S14p/S29e precursor, putative [Plasmodium falciparum 3D7]XP_012763775.1 apicoplast ribosomal protein S14p/S29e precursor, putative [Plasmodium reichenowi]ETW15312.1 hypothetical protein PFFVO_05606 [Plasmodium falciparum Vietnam Oak-Knoll (FVO)]ETW35909.1 hypothetical protein PFTANZ_03502 [Plasmodium falciparum Tanzania (2000708)]ETW53015.1 hypothetical protein PFUGPA_05322 [Plasmodium falciparum Palo Alto/Uganda]ETW60740.1 hypothetical protein PFMC_03440 [Plasm|eukprot:XP_001348056.1 apicoplast ribosomal protein S14p/S29e precursor, putative [Plasmodium falciparum 3D7]